MIRDALLSKLIGHVSITLDGIRYEAHNQVVFNGADVLAALLAGNADYKIAYAYIEFENTVGAPTPIPIDRSNTAVSVHGMAAPQDFLRSPLSATPLLEATSSDYVGNRVTFHATSQANVGVLHGLSFSAGASSQIIAVGLVAAPGQTYSQDVLYARHVLATPLAVTGLGQVSVTWKTEID